MKKIFLISLIFVFTASFVCAESFKGKFVGMANPWHDCEADFACAEKVSGLQFSMRLSNYWIRAMENMFEISYPLDEFRDVSVRKSFGLFEGDNSGVYTKYPINKTIHYDKNIPVKIRGTRNKVYVMNFSYRHFNYSAYCKEGMTKREAKGVYQNVMETVR